MRSVNGTPMFITSVDTKTLVDMLRDAEVNGIVTFDDMEIMVGRNVRTVARGCLQTARRILERDGIVFAAVRGVGLKRLDDHGVVKNTDSDVCSIRRKATRGFQRVSLGVKDYASLSDLEKIKFNANASILGMISTGLQPARVRRFEDKVKGSSGVLPLDKTLEAFKG